ncbi:MAG: SBBP repeat-containing protein [Ignavibacteria bacterium]|nr:SBBP repeat-containing protein [Ignavibacteria bacterium]
MNVSNTFIRSSAILLLTLLIYSDSFSQVSEEWLHRYTGPESSTDTPTKFTKDAEGNFYVTGRTIVGGSYFHIVTVKYNSSGVRQWIAKYIGAANQNDEGTSILTDNSGNVYVSGVSRLVSGQFDIILIKYNPSGIQQWVRQYNGPVTLMIFLQELH